MSLPAFDAAALLAEIRAKRAKAAKRDEDVSHFSRFSTGASVEIGAFEEAAAIAQHDGGLDHDQAEDQAGRDQGYADAVSFREAVVADWLAKLNAWGRGPLTDPIMKQALIDARAFCASEWALQALALGWDELSLFGVHADAPATRLDFMGLVLLLGGHRIAAMTSKTAEILCAGDHRQTCRRKTLDPRQGAVLLWEIER